MKENQDFSETEVKYLSSISSLPAHIQKAMLSFKGKKAISMRGVVKQIYLDANNKDLTNNLLADLESQNIYFGTDKAKNFFKEGGAEQLRLLHMKSILPDKDLYRITYKGHPHFEGYSRKQIETYKKDSSKIQPLFEEYQSESQGKVVKILHSFQDTIKGIDVRVDHNIFTDHNNLMLAEVELSRRTQRQSVESILELFDHRRGIPSYFIRNVTGIRAFASSNLAQVKFEDLPQKQRRRAEAFLQGDKEKVEKIVRFFREKFPNMMF